MDIIGDATLTAIQSPASISATGNSAGLDARSLAGLGCLMLTSRNTAGTNPTLALKLQHSQDTDLIGAITYSGTGNGTITEVEAGPDAVAEDITITFSNATTAAVVGSVSGALGTATVGTKFSCAQVSLLLTAGSAAFVSTDAFTVPVSARSYADVGGGAFAGLTTGSSVQKLNLNFDRLGRYLRMAYTIGGTVSPAYALAVVALSSTN